MISTQKTKQKQVFKKNINTGKTKYTAKENNNSKLQDSIMNII